MSNAINIGLTFYGGVSLAVYEAGVAEEFIRFVQFSNTKGKDVDVRVLSGSSAGGLASIMMSATLVNSSDPNKHIENMRRIWFDVADISKLQYQAGGNVISFLDNDILEKEIKDFLRMKQGPRGLSRNVDKLKILVTGTNMQGFFDAVPIEDDFITKEKFADRAFPTTRHTEVFEFTSKDMKEAGEDPGEDKRARIAKAARVTSSFPAAFPPQFTKSPSFPDETRQLYKNLTEDPLSFWYYDGGVLDNKPLGHAIDYMESSNDDGKWWFFFVDPDPEKEGTKHLEWGRDQKNPPDPSATAASIWDVRGAETIYYDLRRIQQINHQVMQIKSLIADLWSALCAVPSGGEQRQNDLLKRLETNVITARIHRFLPDYLKCTTMLSYRFLKNQPSSDKSANLKAIRTTVTEHIVPFDLRSILRACRDLIEGGKILNHLSPEIKMKLIDGSRAIENDLAMKNYEAAAEKTARTQKQFRQIAYWVEDDYNGEKGELSPETWDAFTKTWDILKPGMDELEKAYDAVEQTMQKVVQDEALFENIKCYMLLNEAVHASAGVETRDTIEVVKIYHNVQSGGRLAGSRLAHFAGFLDRRWRRHDYLMGMKDAGEMLRGKMDPTMFPDAFWQEYDAWRIAEDTKIDQKYGLDPVKDKLQSDEMLPENLPAAKIVPQVNSLLSTFEKLIRKYSKASLLFKILNQLKLIWFSRLVRFFLWLVKQATARPSRETGRDAGTMAQYTSGAQRYLGFTLIGILIGLALSFFLPDSVHDVARFLQTKYESLSHTGKTTVKALIVLLAAFVLRDTLRDIARYLWNGIKKLKKIVMRR